MSLRATEVTAVVAEIAPRIVGGRIQEVRVPTANTVILAIRRPGETIHLLLEAGTRTAAVHTIERPPPNPVKPHGLQGLLRRDFRGVARSLEAIAGGRELMLTLHGDSDRTLRWVGGRSGAIELLVDGRRAGGSGRPAGGSPAGPNRFVAPYDPGIRAHFEAARASGARQALGSTLRRTLTRKLKAARRLVRKRTEEAGRGAKAAAIRREAELLQGHFHQLRRGMDEIVVSDWYDGGAPRTIEVDPALGAAEQVAARFQRAGKFERAAAEAGKRVPEAEERVLVLELLLEELAGCSSEDDLTAFEAQLPRHLRPAVPRFGGRREPDKSLPWRRYLTAGGIEILAGRGARQNDELTHRHAKGNDVWLHVRGRPGAHVVIRSPGQAPTPELLMMGAQVAAAHSQVPDGEAVDVAWTRVKHLRRRKGMAPGAVLVTQERVLHVRASRATLAGLQREDP